MEKTTFTAGFQRSRLSVLARLPWTLAVGLFRMVRTALDEDQRGPVDQAQRIAGLHAIEVIREAGEFQIEFCVNGTWISVPVRISKEKPE